MILEKGNMWDVFGQTDLFLITTNPIVRKDGALVMGRGIAKEAATRFPSLPYDFGQRVQETPKGHCYPVAKYDGQLVGLFMVKDHWRDKAKLSIIKESVELLSKMLFKYDNVINRVDLNFPGIGNGKLAREDVLWMLEELPDKVHVWEFE